jgi:hypothetical protein
MSSARVPLAPRLPAPGPQYDARGEAHVRAQIERTISELLDVVRELQRRVDELEA